jgi:ribonuclease Z
MRPILHPGLVNDRYGDPVLYVEMLFDKRAILFDLGDISNLPARKIHRIEHIFVSHMHVDHFIGFDCILRLLIGRQKTIKLYGPQGFANKVYHKLQAYQWNLVEEFSTDLTFVVTDVDISLKTTTVRFCLKNAFNREVVGDGLITNNVIYSEPMFRVSVAILEHRTPCLAFALEESSHVNVWKARLLGLNLPVGPWLRDLKNAIVEGKPDDYLVLTGKGRTMRLGELRSAVTITTGQKIGYVTDVADTVANRVAIIQLVRNSNLLFIEAAFAAADVDLAAKRAHLTTSAAGAIAREAGVLRIEPFHFSPRYADEEARLLNEVQAAFDAKTRQ